MAKGKKSGKIMGNVKPKHEGKGGGRRGDPGTSNVKDRKGGRGAGY